jgi:hypothetical protein
MVSYWGILGWPQLGEFAWPPGRWHRIAVFHQFNPDRTMNYLRLSTIGQEDD